MPMRLKRNTRLAPLDAGLVLRAYSPWANHQFYGWFWFIVFAL